MYVNSRTVAQTSKMADIATSLSALASRLLRSGRSAFRTLLFVPLVLLASCGGGGGGDNGGGGTVVGGGGGSTTLAISGTISPVALGAGAQLTLSGASSATATADASGNYSFAGLANGSYTVTASGTSLTFSPASAPVTVSGSNVSAVNFTATSTAPGGGGTPPPASTYQISGTVTAGTAGVNVQGLQVALTNTATGMAVTPATTDSSGNFTFAALPNGSYTVMPSGASLTFSPTDRLVTVNGSNVSGVTFTASAVSTGGGGGGGPPPAPTFSVSGILTPAALGQSVQVALSGSSSQTVTTNSSGAFNFSGLADGSYTVTPSGASLNFTPTSRAVAVSGDNVAGVNFGVTAATYAISGTVSPPSLGASVLVTLGGAASATTTTNSSGQFTFPALLNGAYTVTPSGTSLTFAPGSRAVTLSGANQAAVNFTANSVPPNTYTISGSTSPNVQVSLSGPSSGTTTTNSSGAYSFSGLANGTYTVTPSSPSLTFTPANQTVVVSNVDRAGINFTGAATTYAVSGTITPTSLGANIQVALGGASSATTTTNASGDFTFSGLANGNYTVTPSGAARTFNPTNRAITVNGANLTGVSFTATATYSISGTVSPSSLGANVQVALSGASSATTTTNASGAYSFSGLASGSYTVTPSGASLNFNPTNRAVTVGSSNVASIDFTASSTTGNVIFYDDFTGTTLGSAWTALDRSGPSSQVENLCNKPSAVTLSGGNLVITTSATPATCGDAVSSPQQYPYTSGSVQWTSLNFTYGTVEIRAKFPPRNTGTWPALWLLGSNCQAANVVNGSEAVPFMGCPAQGQSAYREIDMVECDTRSWCHLVVAQGTGGWSNMCDFPVDANWHVFTLNWTSSVVSLSIDGTPTGCSFTNTSLKGPAFLIMQTQTTTAAGVGGLPNNANLPTTFQVDYVKVTQP